MRTTGAQAAIVVVRPERMYVDLGRCYPTFGAAAIIFSSTILLLAPALPITCRPPAFVFAFAFAFAFGPCFAFRSYLLLRIVPALLIACPVPHPCAPTLVIWHLRAPYAQAACRSLSFSSLDRPSDNCFTSRSCIYPYRYMSYGRSRFGHSHVRYLSHYYIQRNIPRRHGRCFNILCPHPSVHPSSVHPSHPFIHHSS
ncbi:hypothetical protein C8Q76DRAFT_196536 [Earliella scabrosa]|nr:hypothetical protein C8Q76DRAFT_196536 [Earliella scabrosa]